MSKMGWQTLYRKPNTSWKNKENKIYPYLLKDLKIDHPNQVWGIDITYVPMRRGFMYLCAIIDLHTRYVVNWGISNSMTAQWCCQLVEEAIEMHGKPEIINSDQGSQFTSMEYIEMLLSKGIKISMDGKGRPLIISSLNDYGRALSTNASISMLSRMAFSFTKDSTITLPFTIRNGFISHSIMKHRNRFTRRQPELLTN